MLSTEQLNNIYIYINSQIQVHNTLENISLTFYLKYTLTQLDAQTK